MKTRTLLLNLMTFCAVAVAQKVQVITIHDSLNVSGGITVDKHGNIYLSDFGPRLGQSPGANSNVYKLDKKSFAPTLFATGFVGASGSCIDLNGNFYQSNPFGHSISKVEANGVVNHSWVTDSLKTPVGLVADKDGSVYVSNCGRNSIGKISSDGKYTEFASSPMFKCPNGLASDGNGNLYTCNFGSGNILKIDSEGTVSLITELPILKGQNPVGNGHLVWKHGWLYVATIGTGEIYRVGTEGNYQKIAGQTFAFTNKDGKGSEATFNKPNGIAASITGDTLFVSVSEPAWNVDPLALHPTRVRMVIGVCSLPGSNCKSKHPRRKERNSRE